MNTSTVRREHALWILRLPDMLEALLICLMPVAVDGDTIRCGKTPVRLFGINAVEKGQPGYEDAKYSLQTAIQGGMVCTVKGTSYNRIVATCTDFMNVDVGGEQIRKGQVKEDCTFSQNRYGTCK